MKQLELSYIADGNAKLIQPIWKTVPQFLKKLLYHPAIPLFYVYLTEMKTYVYRKT